MNISGRGVGRAHPPHAHSRVLADFADQSEVSDLQVSSHQKQVARLDIQVLEVELAADEVECLGRIAKIEDQLIPWDSRQRPARGRFRSDPAGFHPPAR